MAVRLWSLLVWALVGASAVVWGLKVGVRPQSLPAQTLLVPAAPWSPISLAVLGGDAESTPAATSAATPAPGPAAGRFVLLGVVSAAAAGAGASPGGRHRASEGVALIAIDGKPPRTFAVGRPVDGPWVLQALSRRTAQLGPAGQPAQLELQMPAPPAPVGGIRAAARP